MTVVGVVRSTLFFVVACACVNFSFCTKNGDLNNRTSGAPNEFSALYRWKGRWLISVMELEGIVLGS